MSRLPAEWLTDGVIGDAPIDAALEAAGWDRRGPVEIAAASDPRRLRGVMEAFVAVGTGLLTTPTRGANRFSIPADAAIGSEEIHRTTAAVCRGVADVTGGRVRVAGTIGPSGRFLALGEVESDELRAAFAEQAAWLKRGGADLLLLEGFSALDEARIALAAALESGLPVVAAMQFETDPDPIRLISGEPAADAARQLAADGADAIGGHCVDPALALLLSTELVREGRRPVWLRVNLANPDWQERRIVHGESPSAFAARAAGLRGAGATIVAGCCGATSNHLRALATAWRRPG